MVGLAARRTPTPSSLDNLRALVPMSYATQPGPPPPLPARKTLYEASPHAPPPPPPPLPPADDSPDAISIWAYSTSATLSGLALPLLLFPRFLAFLAGGFEDGRPNGGSPREGWSGRNAELSGLETFLAAQLGVLCAAAKGLIFVCGWG